MTTPSNCPKCGNTSGWTGPTYRSSWWGEYGHEVLAECLVYTCIQCRYEHQEPTLDRPPSAILHEPTDALLVGWWKRLWL